jgi:type I restriction enzyme S subunit
LKYRPYLSYKDSGVEWLGKIPKHWDVMRFGTNARFVVPMRDKPPLLNGPIPWIRIEDFDGKYIESSKTNQGVDQNTVHEMNLKVFHIGTVLCSCSCDMGATAIIRSPLVSNQTFIGIVPGRNYDPEYVYYLMQVAKQHLTAVATGAIQQYLPKNDFSSLRMPVFPLREQREIASFLDRETAKIDALIEKKERLIELLQEKRTVLITQAVTKGLDPNVPMKDSDVEGLGKIPQHWEVKRLWHLTPEDRQIMYGIVLPGPNVDIGVPIVKGGDVSAERLRVDRLSKTTFDIEAGYVRSRLRGGDLVYAIRGSIGEVAIVPDELTGANLTQDAARIAHNGTIVGQWLLYVLKSMAVFCQLDAGSVGAAVRGINIRDLKRVLVPVPPPNEQQIIADYLESKTAKIDALLDKVSSITKTLGEYRMALISGAVKGQFRVNGDLT